MGRAIMCDVCEKIAAAPPRNERSLQVQLPDGWLYVTVGEGQAHGSAEACSRECASVFVQEFEPPEEDEPGPGRLGTGP